MNKIIEGLMILVKYYPDEEFAASHDQIWYAPYEPKKIAPDDLKRLKKLDWIESDDAWSHFC